MGPPSPTDADLAERAATGDAGALATVLERHRPFLYATAIHLLRNREEARDAVQETCVVALVRIGSLRDPAAVGGWLQRILRNICLMQLRKTPFVATEADFADTNNEPSLDEALEGLALRDWVWAAVDKLRPDDRVTTILRYFSRSSGYDAIAAVTGVPVGTVRSRLNRARSVLATSLQKEADDSLVSREVLEQSRRADWESFYADLHERPVPRTYRATYAADVVVSDLNNTWRGIREWSDHERDAIVLGVRARIVDVVAGSDVTVLEIDFTNPDWAADHCPPRSTFVHHLTDGRSGRLAIQYV